MQMQLDSIGQIMWYSTFKCSKYKSTNYNKTQSNLTPDKNNKPRTQITSQYHLKTDFSASEYSTGWCALSSTQLNDAG